MATGFELERKIEDIKAHYSIVKTELNTVTQQVSDAIELKKQKLAEVNAVQDEIKTLHETVLGLRAELTTKLEQLKEAQDKLAKARDNKREVEAEMEESVIVLRGTIDRLNEKIAQLKAREEAVLPELNEKIKLKKEKIDSLNAVITDLEGQVAQKNKQLETLRNKIKEELVEADTIKKDIQQRDTELKLREVDVENQRTQLAELVEEVNSRLEVVIKKEADVKVIENRIKKWYEEHRPSIKPNI